MIKIRLSRGGKRNIPFFKIVAIDKTRKAKRGKPIDFLGYWQPEKKILSLDKKKYELWISKGAQSSISLKNLLKNQGY